VAQLLCFNRYLYTLFLLVILSIYPLNLSAAGPVQAEPDALSAERSQQQVTRKQQDLVDISTPVQPQRILAPFEPAYRFNSLILSEDTVWSGAIQVEGMVTVAAQATLTIMPGTIVRFGDNSGIFVLGRIVAKGASELPITLASQYSDPAAADWYGIVLTGTSKKNVFEQTKIQGAATAIYARSSSTELKNIHVENSSVAIKLADSIASLKELVIAKCSSGLYIVKSEVDIESVAVDGCETAMTIISSALTAVDLKISHSSQAALVAEKSQLKIENSVFSGNLAGVMIIDCEGSFNNSKFINNSDTAVTLSGSLLRFSSNLVSGNKIGIQLVDNLPSIWGNSIYANSTYNLLYLGEGLLYAGGNWFDTVNPDLLNKSLFTKRAGAIQVQPLLAANPLTGLRKAF